jgi:hypothetical protein
MRVLLSRGGIERALRGDKSFHRGVGCTYSRLMHSHRRKGQSLRGIGCSHLRVIHSHHREIHSCSLTISTFHRKVIFHPDDGHTFCDDCSSFHREKPFFRRIMSVNHRMMRVHRHAERVHSAIVHSPCGIGCMQCRNESSPEENVSYHPCIGMVIHRKLCIHRRMESTPCG